MWSPPWHFKMYIWTSILYIRRFYLTYILTFYLAFILASYLTFYPAFYLAFFLVFYLAYILAFYSIWRWGPVVPTGLERSPVEVQLCPLGSGGPRLRSSGAHRTREVPGWGPAVPTAKCLLRSSGAHWDRELAGAGSWDLAVPTAIRSWRGGEEEERRGREEKARRAMLKPNNPHLAGGEKKTKTSYYIFCRCVKSYNYVCPYI